MKTADVDALNARREQEPELRAFLDEQSRPIRSTLKKLSWLAVGILFFPKVSVGDFIESEAMIGGVFAGVAYLGISRELRLARLYDRKHPQPVIFEEPAENWANTDLTAHWESTKAMLSGDKDHPLLAKWAASDFVGHWATTEALLAEAS